MAGTFAHAIPRAVYEGVANMLMAISLLLVLFAYLQVQDIRLLTRNTPPSSPPPRAA